MQGLEDVTDRVTRGQVQKQETAAVPERGVGNEERATCPEPPGTMEERSVWLTLKEPQMQQVFETKDKEKDRKLKDSEAELQQRHEQMKD